MTDSELFTLLAAVRDHTLPAEEVLRRLRNGPYRESDLGFAQPDHHRRMRLGTSEVIYGECKSVEQILAIAADLSHSGHPVLVTRLAPDKIAALAERFPSGRANPVARTFILNPRSVLSASPEEPHVAVLAAGTGDLPVAEEACEVCVAMETPHARYYDVGVAGLHRLLAKIDALRSASALVVVAGMEGALPSVVAGLLGRPVFAVPSSVGYGVSFSGVTALLAMLNSCAPGVTVSNINNGFSAAFAACQVARAVRSAQSRNYEQNSFPR